MAAADYQPADIVQVDGPDRVQPQSQAHYRVTIQNHSDVDWPATTELRLATATQSALYDDSWLSPTVIATLGNPVPAGTMGEVSFDVTTPAVSEETAVFEELVLAAGDTQLGGVQLAVTVVPGMAEPTSSDADDHHDDEGTGDTDDAANDPYGAQLSGGCAAGGGSLGFAAFGLLLAVRRRRRR